MRLSPTGLRADFDALPTGWTVTPSGGDATAAGGSLTVDGARIDSGTPLGPGQVLEFRATFGAVLNQHVGLAADLGGGPWALVQHVERRWSLRPHERGRWGRT